MTARKRSERGWRVVECSVTGADHVPSLRGRNMRPTDVNTVVMITQEEMLAARGLVRTLLGRDGEAPEAATVANAGTGGDAGPLGKNY